MSKSNLKKVSPILVLAILLSACTKTVILYKPSAHIKPMPNMAACPKKDEADPKFKDQWNLAQLGITEEVLKSGAVSGNSNVRIAILSTGIDYNHEDLCGQVAINKAEIVQKGAGEKPAPSREDLDKNGLVGDVVGYDVVDGDGLAYDRHGAGTAVAGIIAANQRNGVGIAGIMKQVTLIPIRYIDDNGQTSVGNLAAALDAALKLKPHVIFLQTAEIQIGGREQNPELINDEISLIKTYLDKIRDAKIPVVVGAGDNMQEFGSGALEKLLKSYENILVVTSLDKDGKKSMLANSHGQDVVIAAPGENIISLKPGNKYGEVSGTAYAAAHVTAAIGLARVALADRLEIGKVISILVSAKGSEADTALERDTRGGTRLHLVKFLNELRGQE